MYQDKYRKYKAKYLALKQKQALGGSTSSSSADEYQKFNEHTYAKSDLIINRLNTDIHKCNSLSDHHRDIYIKIIEGIVNVIFKYTYKNAGFYTQPLCVLKARTSEIVDYMHDGPTVHIMIPTEQFQNWRMPLIEKHQMTKTSSEMLNNIEYAGVEIKLYISKCLSILFGEQINIDNGIGKDTESNINELLRGVYKFEINVPSTNGDASTSGDVAITVERTDTNKWNIQSSTICQYLDESMEVVSSIDTQLKRHVDERKKEHSSKN